MYNRLFLISSEMGMAGQRRIFAGKAFKLTSVSEFNVF
jgi:hypothetical protein